jgi:hypothetical protein
VLLSDRVLMMTNGPAATVGEILHVDLPRPRNRVQLADDSRYHHMRQQILHFLYEKQDRDYLCEWKRVSIPFYIFFPCTTAWRFSSDYSRNNEQLCKFPLRD